MTARRALPVLFLVAGCSDPDLDVCFDDPLIIAQGVYGQTFSGCDTPDCRLSYAPDVEIRVYDRHPGICDDAYSPPEICDREPAAASLITVQSGRMGFYQIGLPPGAYYFCVVGGRGCAEIPTSRIRPLVRKDWGSGVDGGRWFDSSCSDDEARRPTRVD